MNMVLYLVLLMLILPSEIKVLGLDINPVVTGTSVEDMKKVLQGYGIFDYGGEAFTRGEDGKVHSRMLRIMAELHNRNVFEQRLGKPDITSDEGKRCVVDVINQHEDRQDEWIVIECLDRLGVVNKWGD